VTKEATTTASATLTKYITGTESTSNQKTTQEHNNEAPNAEAGGSPGLLPQTSLGLVLVVSSVGLGTLVIISKRVLTRSRGHPQGTDEYETH
jgi:hypothetical protein